jgi:Ca2+-binding RTX toxin-like protein
MAIRREMSGGISMAGVKIGTGLDNSKELLDVLLMHIHRQVNGNTPSRVAWEYHKDAGWDYETFQRDVTVTYYGRGLRYDGNGHPTAGTVTNVLIKDASGKMYLDLRDLSVSFRYTVHGTDSAYFFEQALRGADLITGTNGSQSMKGWGGNDDLRGYGGNDRIEGGAHSDKIYGGDGNDTILGDSDGDWNWSITNGHDTVKAGNGNDKVYGGGGNDTLYGEDGDDILYGDDAPLYSGEGKNTLDGGAGKDTLVGSEGCDIFIGGTEADRFVFRTRTESDPVSNNRPDVIKDFSHAQGDKINVTDIDANNRAKGDQDFTFIGTHEFDKIGQVRYEHRGGNTYVELNVDSYPRDAETVIMLQGIRHLKASDFIL